MTGDCAQPRDFLMEARHPQLTENRARAERRRAYVIITGMTMFAIAARILML